MDFSILLPISQGLSCKNTWLGKNSHSFQPFLKVLNSKLTKAKFCLKLWFIKDITVKRVEKRLFLDLSVSCCDVISSVSMLFRTQPLKLESFLTARSFFLGV